jgi:hypothetical protein
MSTDVIMRTRRAMLGAGLGALAATVASALARPAAVRAEGETIHVGDKIPTAASATVLKNSTTNRDVFRAETTKSGRALAGTSASGIGVAGNSDIGSGMYGYSDTGYGVLAESALGTAVRAATGNGYALVTSGRLDLSTSGVATIPAGATSVIVEPGVIVTAGTLVLLTSRVNLKGRDLWFTTDEATDTFTIRMSATRTNITKVSWLLLG